MEWPHRGHPTFPRRSAPRLLREVQNPRLCFDVLLLRGGKLAAHAGTATLKKSIRISRHIEMQDLTPVVADDEKAVQNTESERWDCEKVHRSNGLAMVSEERQPSLHRM